MDQKPPPSTPESGIRHPAADHPRSQIFWQSPAEQVFMFVLDRSPTAIAVLDRNGQILYANRAHRSLFDTVSSQQNDPYEIRVAAVLAENPHWHHIIAPVTIDRMQLTSSILFDQTRLKEAEEAYRVMVEHSLQGLVIIGVDHVLFANSTISTVLGYSHEEMTAFSFDELIDTVIHPQDRERLRRFKKARFSGGSPPNHYEFRCIRKDGTVCWMELHVSMISYRGEPAIQAALADITERKEAVRTLEAREQQFKALAEHSPDLIVRIERDITLQYVNQTVTNLFEVRAGYRIPDSDSLREDMPDWRREYESIFTTGIEKTICFHAWTSQGTRYYHVRTVPERNADGKVETLLSIARDITDIRDAESALKHTEANLEETQRLALVGSWELYVDSGILRLSDMIYEILDIPHETIPPLFSHFRRFLHPADRNVFRQVQNAFRTASPSFSLEHRIVRPDGEIRWIHQRAKAVEYLNSRPVRLVGSMQDITERKEAEEALRRSEEKYRDLVENISDVLYVVDSNDAITYISPAVRQLFGYHPDEVVGKPFWSFMYPEDMPHIRQAYETLPSGEDQVLDLRILRRSGESVWVTASIRPILVNGAARGFQGTITDITVRKQAEEYRRYKELFEHVADGVFILDDRLRFCEVSERLARKIGHPHSTLLKTPLQTIIPPGREDMLQPIRDIIADNRQGHCEVELTTAAGTSMLLDLSIRPVHYQNRLCFLCISRDITETVALRDQLLLSERLAATGQLAASIAHEINSPLQAITVMLGMMGDQWLDDNEYQENIHLLADAFASISATVKSLLDLNRPGNQHYQATYINDIIEKSATLIQGTLTEHKIRLIMHLAPELPVIHASPQQLSQVLLNIFNNAIEAMHGHDTANQEPDIAGSERELRISTRAAEHSIVIRISDTGPGIEPDAIKHIFEPFYTRKKRMGIGIGLSVCHSIVQSHHGDLLVRNRPGGGAVFTIVLPENPTA